MKRVTPQEAKALLDQGYRYIDVRSEGEFAQGHPAGAYNVPLAHAGAQGMSPNPDFVAVMKANFPTDAKLVIGCLAGGRSARACQALEAHGYSALVDQTGGWGGNKGPPAVAGWGGSGLPEAQGAPAGHSYADLSKPKGA